MASHNNPLASNSNSLASHVTEVNKGVAQEEEEEEEWEWDEEEEEENNHAHPPQTTNAENYWAWQNQSQPSSFTYQEIQNRVDQIKMCQTTSTSQPEKIPKDTGGK